MHSTLPEQLEQIPRDVAELLTRHHFDRPNFLSLASGLEHGARAGNRVSGVVQAPAPSDVQDLPIAGSTAYEEIGRLGDEALRNGQCALVVLAGGMATRMGGVVKALVDALPGQRFLDLRLNEIESLRRRLGRAVPLWLMTSHATDGEIRRALGDRADGYTLATFPQRLSLRLTPQGDLFHDRNGELSLYAPGHGDLPDALRDSGLLQRFVAAGGRYLTVANLDNLGAGLDRGVIGCHIAHGKPLTCEVVDKQGSDRGGIPVRLDGRPVVLEEFRLPTDFDPTSVRVFNTNTFHFDAAAVLAADFAWTYFTVEKTVEGKPAIQFERLVGELTSHLDTRFLHVPRAGSAARFLPVKDHDELSLRRAEIELVARHRGMIA